MRKNQENFGYLFSRKNTRSFYKDRLYILKILKTFTENFGRDSKLRGIFMTCRWNIESVLIRISGISIKMFTNTLLELWIYFEKIWGDFGYIL